MDYLKRCEAVIDLDAVSRNLENYKSFLPEETELMCVVKASCYGHCDRAIVPYLQEKHGVRYFAVSNITEAIRLRDCGVKGDILILGYTCPEEAEKLCEYSIIQAVTELSYAKALSEHANGKTVRCHCAIDTGMTRIGVRGTVESCADEIERVSALEGIALEGVFTHFAVADSDGEDNFTYTDMQQQKIIAVTDELKRRGITLRHSHFMNSAAGVYRPDPRSSLARLGIILYGLMPNTAKALPFELSPVMTLRATISMIKTVEPGTQVSYGRTFTAQRPTRLATITCGYADGYPRALSNKGYVLINGRRAKITGRICMDQFMCDVTDIENVRVGDYAVLIGKSGEEMITADDIADMTGTIGYEIVCGISSRVPRVIMSNNTEIDVF
ncbi:MAG: alanine racemase [Ruminococcus sp.]|nr:alanine racemase [Ruminococcus sp.]